VPIAVAISAIQFFLSPRSSPRSRELRMPAQDDTRPEREPNHPKRLLATSFEVMSSFRPAEAMNIGHRTSKCLARPYGSPSRSLERMKGARPTHVTRTRQDPRRCDRGGRQLTEPLQHVQVMGARFKEDDLRIGTSAASYRWKNRRFAHPALPANEEDRSGAHTCVANRRVALHP
jgi:hypothetical protein